MARSITELLAASPASEACNGTHKLMLFKIPAMHPTRTTNRNDQSTMYYTISDRMPHPRSTAPQTQTVTEQKGNTVAGHGFVTENSRTKRAAFQHRCRLRIALFSSKAMISFDRHEPRRNEMRRSGRKSTATDTTARQPRGHQAAGARAPLPIPQHISHVTRIAEALLALRNNMFDFESMDGSVASGRQIQVSKPPKRINGAHRVPERRPMQQECGQGGPPRLQWQP